MPISFCVCAHGSALQASSNCQGFVLYSTPTAELPLSSTWERIFVARTNLRAAKVAGIHLFALEINEGKREVSGNQDTQHRDCDTPIWFAFLQLKLPKNIFPSMYLTFSSAFKAELNYFLLIKEIVESFCPVSK